MDTAQHPLLFGDVTVVDRQLLGLSERGSRRSARRVVPDEPSRGMIVA
jgi:hypothetical protein